MRNIFENNNNTIDNNQINIADELLFMKLKVCIKKKYTYLCRLPSAKSNNLIFNTVNKFQEVITSAEFCFT